MARNDRWIDKGQCSNVMWIVAGSLVSVVRSTSREDLYFSRIQTLTVFPVVGMSLGMAV